MDNDTLIQAICMLVKNIDNKSDLSILYNIILQFISED